MLGNDPEKEDILGRTDHLEKAPSSLSDEEVEKFRALFSETGTGEEVRELSRKDNKMEDDPLPGPSESEEKPLMCKDLNTPSVQFFDDADDDDADDTKDVDVLTVKRRNIFDVETKSAVTLVSSF